MIVALMLHRVSQANLDTTRFVSKITGYFREAYSQQFRRFCQVLIDGLKQHLCISLRRNFVADVPQH